MYVSCGRFFLLDSSCRIFGTGLLHGLPRGRGKTVATTPLGVGFDFEENREIEATLLLLLSLFISVCYYLSLSLSKQGQKSCGYRPPYPSSLFPFLFFFSAPNSRHKFLDEGRRHKRFVAKRLFTSPLHLSN